MTVTARSTLTTNKASGYLQQLCKHFGHKVPVTFDPARGRIEFSVGVCELAAEDATLSIHLHAPTEADMPVLKDVVASHLQRFAFRDGLVIDWD